MVVPPALYAIYEDDHPTLTSGHASGFQPTTHPDLGTHLYYGFPGYLI